MVPNQQIKQYAGYKDDLHVNLQGIGVKKVPYKNQFKYSPGATSVTSRFFMHRL